MRSPKLKASQKDGKTVVKARLGKGEKINQRELAIFQQKLIRGMMRPFVERSRIIYMAPSGIPLREYVRKGLSKDEFFVVVAQVVEVLKKVDRYSLNINNLVLNQRLIYVNEKTKEVNFIYQPLQSVNAGVNVFSLLYDLAYDTVFALDVDIRFVNEFVAYLQSLQQFSVYALEAYLIKVYPEVYQHVQRLEPGQSQTLSSKPWETNGKSADEEGTALLNEDGETTELLEEDTDGEMAPPMGTADNGTDMLYEDDDGTSILLGNHETGTALLRQREVQRFSYLIRQSTQERIKIDKPAFRLGKGQGYVDYVVANNNAVSRIHADIITKEYQQFIRDNNSTNGTFVNGLPVRANVDTPIFSGDRITLANEEFVLYIA